MWQLTTWFDNFGVNYTNKKDAEHLFETIQKRFSVKSDWETTFYLCITLQWDWKNQTCKLSMPGYVKQALLKFNHVLQQACYSPSPYQPPVYGKKQQMVYVDKTEPMDKTQIKLLQQVCETFLYYATAVDCTMLHALNDLATRVTDGTQTTVKALQHFLDYCATNPEDTVLY